MGVVHPPSLFEKISALPAERISEVEDFVDFLRQRDEDQSLLRGMQGLIEPAFDRVWSNPEDDVYDDL